MVIVPKFGIEGKVFVAKKDAVAGPDAPLVFDEDNQTLSGAGISLRIFDTVRIRISVVTPLNQRKVLRLKLVEPALPWMDDGEEVEEAESGKVGGDGGGGGGVDVETDDVGGSNQVSTSGADGDVAAMEGVTEAGATGGTDGESGEDSSAPVKGSKAKGKGRAGKKAKTTTAGDDDAGEAPEPTATPAPAEGSAKSKKKSKKNKKNKNKKKGSGGNRKRPSSPSGDRDQTKRRK